MIRKNEKRRAHRRRVLQGYPVEARLMSVEEINYYFSAERIICLLCGRVSKALDYHLYTIHDMTVDDYRALYGLPWKRALSCPDTHRRRSVATHRRIDEGFPFPEFARLGLATQKARGISRRQSHYQSELVRRGNAQRRYGSADFELVLALVAGGISVRAATIEPGIPGLRWVRKWCAGHPEDNARLKVLRRVYGAAGFERFLALVAGGMSPEAANNTPGVPSKEWVRLWRASHPEDDARLLAFRAQGAGRAA